MPLELPEGSPAELANRAENHLEAAQEAAQQGDWGRYGEELQNLEEIIRQLVTVTGGTMEETP
jgi:flagellin-specific chaperone FliS